MSRAQLLRLDVPARTIERWLAKGLLIPVHRGVYAVGHLATNPLDTAHAALLAGGPSAALAGESAIVLWGVWRRWPAQHEIIVTADRRLSDVTVRQSSTLSHRDITVEQAIRVTTPARTLLDITPRMNDRQLLRAVNDLRLQHHLTVGAIRDVVDRNRRHPGAGRLRSTIDEAQREPTRSELEDRFLQMLQRFGLPTPQVNVHVAGYRVDAFFPNHRLIVELDGWATHGTRHAFRRDRRQDAEILAATGIPTIRLSYDDTTTNAPETAQRLAAILSARR